MTANTESEEVITPRHAYHNHQKTNQRTKAAMMMTLDEQAMRNLRAEFKKHDWALGIRDFVESVKVNSSAAAAVMDYQEEWALKEIALCDIFREIDVNGDGDMSWEEFTGYLVDVASADADLWSGSKPIYTYKKTEEDNTNHEYAIHSIYYFQAINKIILLEGKGSWFKVYTPDMQHLKTVTGHRAPILTVDYLEKSNIMITCSQDSTIKLWDANKFTLKDTIHTSHPVVSLCCIGNAIFAGDPGGDIYQISVDYGQVQRVLSGHTDCVMALVVLTGREEIASASLGKHIPTCMECKISTHIQRHVSHNLIEEYTEMMNPYSLRWEHQNLVDQRNGAQFHLCGARQGRRGFGIPSRDRHVSQWRA